jgi:cellulose biosynthesis protein BcsQ
METTIAFFNNKGGVGKTSLVYHLACMYADTGYRVLAVDLDPQANLSTMFLTESRLESILDDQESAQTVLGCVRPILEGLGDIGSPHVEEVQTPTGEVGLIIGDLGLSKFEDKLSESWPKTLDGDVAALRSITAFSRIITLAISQYEADVALIDVGPNLGAINRSALIAAEHVVIPLAPDLFSLQGLRNLGPTLDTWRTGWKKRLDETKTGTLSLPMGHMQPAGYVVLQHAMRLDRPVSAYTRWMSRIPSWYRTYLRNDIGEAKDVADDPECLALLKNYRSLMPLAQEARKPMFSLKVADGALGAQQYAVADCYRDFELLATRVAEACSVKPRARAS